MKELMKTYIELSLRSVGISVIDDINRTDLLYITINPSREIWTEKRKITDQPLSLRLNEHLDQHYQSHSVDQRYDIGQNRVNPFVSCFFREFYSASFSVCHIC
jgi:hypothetical protein